MRFSDTPWCVVVAIRAHHDMGLTHSERLPCYSGIRRSPVTLSFVGSHVRADRVIPHRACKQALWLDKGGTSSPRCIPPVAERGEGLSRGFSSPCSLVGASPLRPQAQRR